MTRWIRTVLPLALLGQALMTSLVHAQTKWDLPAAYPATNFHTQNLERFAAEVVGSEVVTLHEGAERPVEHEDPLLAARLGVGLARCLVDDEQTDAPVGRDVLHHLQDDRAELEIMGSERARLRGRLANREIQGDVGPS